MENVGVGLDLTRVGIADDLVDGDGAGDLLELAGPVGGRISSSSLTLPAIFARSRQR
jgi:hypothetical protein